MDGYKDEAQDKLVLRTSSEYGIIYEKPIVAEQSAKNAKQIKDILW